jgi:predicted HicB family RNase H-like nuclease
MANQRRQFALVLRIPKDLKARLKATKRKTGSSYNQLTIAALESWLKKEAR